MWMFRSLRFSRQSTMALDIPQQQTDKQQQTTAATHQPYIGKEAIMEPIPELKYLSWSALEDLPAQQFELDPMQYFVLHVSLRALHLHGHDRNHLAMNIILDSRMSEVEEAIKYKDAMLTIGPPQHALDFNDLRKTFISAPTLPTQHSFTLQDSLLDNFNSHKGGANALGLHKSGGWPAVEDVIYALLNHQLTEQEEDFKKGESDVNELKSAKKRRWSETMIPSQSNSMMLFNNQSMSHHWRLVAPSQAPPSLDLSHDSHLIRDKTLGESESDSHQSSSATAQVLVHDTAMTRLCGNIPAALVAWSLANSSHSDSANSSTFDCAEAVGEIIEALEAEIEQGMDALLVVQLLPMIDYDYHEEDGYGGSAGYHGTNEESVGADAQARGEFVLSLHSLYS